MSFLLQGGTIVTVNSRNEIFQNTSLLIENDRITAIGPTTATGSSSQAEIIDAHGLVIIPGLIQTHIHLCQTLFRGLADDLELLDWLKEKIFPMEAAHNEHSIYISAMFGIAELIISGTTTILDMGSIHHEEEIIRAAGESGMRAFVGKSMMDCNDIYPKLKESTEESLKSTRKLAEQYHNSYDGMIKYAVAPRFIISCSDRLMREAYEMTKDIKGMLFHTHASENRTEITKVRQRCDMENIEYLNNLGVLSARTVLAHCVHLNENEFQILQSTKSNVAHCPSSNLKLGSGVANTLRMQSMGINVSLGADGAPCNNNLNMFHEMRLASLIQKPIHGPTAMPAQQVLKMATINGARALGLEQEIGSIEIGKKADLVLLDLNKFHNPIAESNDLYSSLVYSARPENVDSVMIGGKWVYRKKEFIGIDEKKLRSDSQLALKKLLNRID